MFAKIMINQHHTDEKVNELFHMVAGEWQLITTDLVIVTDNAADMLEVA